MAVELVIECDSCHLPYGKCVCENPKFKTVFRDDELKLNASEEDINRFDIEISVGMMIKFLIPTVDPIIISQREKIIAFIQKEIENSVNQLQSRFDRKDKNKS
jgi:hypothetical protein